MFEFPHFPGTEFFSQQGLTGVNALVMLNDRREKHEPAYLSSVHFEGVQERTNLVELKTSLKFIFHWHYVTEMEFGI